MAYNAHECRLIAIQMEWTAWIFPVDRAQFLQLAKMWRDRAARLDLIEHFKVHHAPPYG
jgi:hypothetical protein